MNERSRAVDRRKGTAVNIILAIFLIALAVACLCVGKYSVSVPDCFRILFGGQGSAAMDGKIVLGIRLPRVLAAMLVGASLALSGAVYQGIFKNPLVSPDFLGVSAGACIGAAVGILMSFGGTLIQVFAFIGGLAAVFLTLLIPKAVRSSSNIMLVLSGIIVSGAMSSILGFIKYIADPETQLAAITYWQLGSFADAKMQKVVSVLPLSAAAMIILIAMSFWIDVMSLGEREASALGANVPLLRGICITCATILTAGAVCISGTIGWVGLVIPHFGRMMVGSGNRTLLPTSCLLGAAFMLLVDTVTRIIGPAEMPVSILTGIIGAPFYAWLLYRQRERLG